MRSQHLVGRVNLLSVSRIVSGDLGSFRSTEAGALHRLTYLLTARTGGVKVLLRVALYFRCAAPSWHNLVAEPCQAVSQLRLVHSRRKLL